MFASVRGRASRKSGKDFNMSHSFGATSTTDDVLSGKDLSGKRVLVTGVSAGLGVETARALAAHGAQVVGAARDLAQAERRGCGGSPAARTRERGGGTLAPTPLSFFLSGHHPPAVFVPPGADGW